MQGATSRIFVAWLLAILTLSAAGCGSRIPDEPHVCNPSNCDGCCLMGTCVIPSGQTSGACGKGGVSCAPCLSNQICDPAHGGCVWLLPGERFPSGACGATCSGCCNPLTNVCIELHEQNNDACGRDNQDCLPCVQSASCVLGSCRPRDPPPPWDKCDPALECFSPQTSRCQLGLTRWFCGRDGTCSRCAPDQLCIDGTCKPSSPAMEACMTSCAGKGCCDDQAKCLEFAGNQDELLESLLGRTDLSHTQTDLACGTETCTACPTGYHCRAQVGMCMDERDLKDLRIRLERVVIADPAANDGNDTDQLWARLWKDNTPRISVHVRVGNQPEVRVVRSGHLATISIQTAVNQYVSQRCSSWQRLWNGQCQQQAADSYETHIIAGDSIRGYVFGYGHPYTPPMDEDSLRATEIAFDIYLRDVDLQPGPMIAHCTGEIVDASALQADCNRKGLTRCQQDCLDKYTSADSRRDECLGSCYWQHEACLYDDGLVATFAIRTHCDKGYVLLVEANALLAAPWAQL